ncbi:hypothetical protein [Vibrio mimicus]|uniref:hypothetical protein n=1 Tax=Vibrio mimicus TaxID=674 RepID=UPI0016524B78|nr:hypothetical protein [Vibrio mimicus]
MSLVEYLENAVFNTTPLHTGVERGLSRFPQGLAEWGEKINKMIAQWRSYHF